MVEKILIGKITHYYPKISVAVIDLEETLRRGDRIEIEGKTTKLSQLVTSMQIEHKDVDIAEKGKSVGIKVEEKVREGDKVYKIIE